MKRILSLAFTLALVLPVAAAAEELDTLLTPDGTLYTIESEIVTEQNVSTTEPEAAMVHLVLTSQNGTEIQRQVVPGSSASGVHRDPAMAYDAGTGTLFIIWLCQNAGLTSELLLETMQSDGTWSDAVPFGEPFRYRENLSIAVTRSVTEEESGSLVPGTSVHAIWWEFNTHTGLESAQYAMLSIVEGRIDNVAFMDLAPFIPSEAIPVTDTEPPAILRHPSIFSAPDNALVVFGDLATQQFYRVRVRPMIPASEVRIHIPSGKGEGSFGPPLLSVTESASVKTLDGGPGRFAFIAEDGEQVRYSVLKNGEWSPERSISLGDRINEITATTAIHRLLEEN